MEDADTWKTIKAGPISHSMKNLKHVSEARDKSWNEMVKLVADSTRTLQKPAQTRHG